MWDGCKPRALPTLQVSSRPGVSLFLMLRGRILLTPGALGLFGGLAAVISLKNGPVGGIRFARLWLGF
jgi:hypothetical protein